MGVESIEIGDAEDGFKAHLHDNPSTLNLVNSIYLEDISFSDVDTDLESIGWRAGIREWLVLSCISLVAMMDAFDTTMMIPVVPDLSSVFEQPLRSALWIDASYLVANAASQPLFAMLSEVFGQGPILIISVVIATIGTGVCSGSMDMFTLVAGRLVQGIGSGGAMAVSILVMADLVPYPHRIRFCDYICRAWALGAIFGPILGGLFGEYVNWTWIFYSSFVFCALSLLVIPFAIDLKGCNKISWRAMGEMDWLGATFMLLGISCLLVGLSWVGRPSPSGWGDWRILAFSCVGGFAMLGLVLYENIWATQPMFNLAIFNSIPTIMVYIGGLLHGLLLLCHLQNLPMYLILVKYLSPALAGLGIVVITAPVLPALLLTAKMGIARNASLSRWVVRAGWALNLLASSCFILLDAETPSPGWVFIFFVTGASHALLISGYNTCTHREAVVNHKPGQGRQGLCQHQHQHQHQRHHHHQPYTARRGRASSPAFAVLMYSILRTWGMCIAVPVSGTIVLTQMAQEVEGNSGAFSGSLLRLGEVMLSRDDRDELSVAFLNSFRVVWRFFMAVSVLGGMSSLLIR